MLFKKLSLLGLFMPFIASCQSPVKSDKPIIIASFYAMEDLTRKIVGDKFEIITLVENGAEPHDYEPSIADMRQMQESKLIVTNGLGVENWTADLPTMYAEKTIEVSDDERITTLITDRNIDPHVWLDPVYAEIEMEKIKEQVVKIDPANGPYYESRYRTYSRLFSDFNAGLKSDFAPYADRVFVTSHKAYSYFAARYGLKNIALNGLSPDDEPSAGELAALIEQIKALNISTIFYENFSSDASVKILSHETNTAIETLLTLENLTSEEKFSSDYLFLMRQNADKLLASMRN